MYGDCIIAVRPLAARALRGGARSLRLAVTPQARAVFVLPREVGLNCSLLLPLRLAAVRRPRRWVAVAPNLNKRGLTLRDSRVRGSETSGLPGAAVAASGSPSRVRECGAYIDARVCLSGVGSPVGACPSLPPSAPRRPSCRPPRGKECEQMFLTKKRGRVIMCLSHGADVNNYSTGEVNFFDCFSVCEA